MRIQHNIMAMSAYRNYTNNVSAMKKNLEKLSSGYKINRAGDDAAGLAISEKMRAQITGLETAQKNAKDGISLVQTAEGALTEVHDMLNRMVELATQSANGTYDNTTDRNQMQKEVNQLLSEIDRISKSSNFNGINLLDGTLGLNTDVFQIAAGDTYQAQVDPKAVNVTTSDYHGGEAVAGQAPSFTVDLNDIALVNSNATASKALKFKISFGDGKEITATTASVSAGGTASASAIKTAVKTALEAATWATGSDGNGGKLYNLGGMFFSASVGSTSIKFDFYATKGTATASQVWNDVVSGSAGKTKADAWNNAVLGADVKVEAVAGDPGKLKDGMTEIHAHTSVANAVANQPADRPGISVDLAGLVQNGYKLSIASGTGTTAKKTTYVFKTDKDFNPTLDSANGEVLIDVSMVEGSAEQAKHAAWIIAGGSVQNAAGTAPDGANAGGASQTAANSVFKIGYSGGTKLHFDVAASSKASVGNTEDKMKKLITAMDAGSDEKIASTKLYVTGKAKEGNVLNIGSDKIEFDGGEDIDAVMAAIQGKGYTVTKETDSDGKEYLNIEGKNTDADGNPIANKDITGPQILGKGLTLQIGDTSDDFNQLNVAVQNMNSESIGIGGLDISTEEAAQAATDKIKKAINTVSDVRGTLGATQNRLDHTINNLSVMTENIQDAESTIRDVDVAEEMMAYTKNNILIQSAQAMLAQANQVPQGVLQLLG